jgi:hypothetical protein
VERKGVCDVVRCRYPTDHVTFSLQVTLIRREEVDDPVKTPTRHSEGSGASWMCQEDGRSARKVTLSLRLHLTWHRLAPFRTLLSRYI